MKVLIGNPVFRRPVGDDLERYMLGSGMRFPWSLLKHKDERPRYAMFPFFLSYTAALLEQDGVDVRVVDAVPLNLTDEEFITRVAECAPDLLVLEPNSAVIDDVLALVSRLARERQMQVVLTGTHASAFAGQLLDGHILAAASHTGFCSGEGGNATLPATTGQQRRIVRRPGKQPLGYRYFFTHAVLPQLCCSARYCRALIVRTTGA